MIGAPKACIQFVNARPGAFGVEHRPGVGYENLTGALDECSAAYTVTAGAGEPNVNPIPGGGLFGPVLDFLVPLPNSATHSVRGW